MFVIYGGKQNFTQWDLNQLVTNPCMQEGDEVVFYNSHGATYVVNAFAQDGEILADVPNYLLQMEGNILVDLGQGLERHTECRTTFTVVAQAKPEGYNCQYNVPDRPAKTGGVSSWHDLTDKPFYETKEVVEILPECRPPYVAHVNAFTWTETFPNVTVGETYIVNWNGTDYTCVAQNADGKLGIPKMVGLGNATDWGLVGNDEPFTIAVVPNQTTMMMDKSGSNLTEVTVSIRQEQTTITPLPTKYLPKGVPYLEKGGMSELPVAGAWTEADEGMYMFAFSAPVGLVIGENYIVNWNGTEHEVTAQDMAVMGMPEGTGVYLGNAALAGGTLDTGEPFAISEYGAEIAAEAGFYGAAMAEGYASNIPFTIYGAEIIAHKLDPRCLPDESNLFTVVADLKQGSATTDVTIDKNYSEIAAVATDPNVKVRALVRLYAVVDGTDVLAAYYYLDLTSFNVAAGRLEFAAHYNAYNFYLLTIKSDDSKSLDIVSYKTTT